MTEYALCCYDEETGEWAAMDTRMVESRKAALATIPEVIRLQQRIAELEQRGEPVWWHHANEDEQDIFLNMPFGLPDETPLCIAAPSPEDK